MHPHTALAITAISIGIAALYLISEYADPEPIPIYAAKQYIDQTVTIKGTPTISTKTDTYVKGEIQATCTITFTHFTTNPDKINQTSRFVGIVQNYNGNANFLVEEVK